MKFRFNYNDSTLWVSTSQYLCILLRKSQPTQSTTLFILRIAKYVQEIGKIYIYIYIYILTHQIKRRIWLYQACAKNTLSSHSASISFNKALLLFVMNTAPPTSIPTSPTTISGRLPQTYYDISCETALLVTDWFFLFFSYETLSCLNLNPMDGRQWKTLLFCWHHHLTNTTLLEI